MSKAIYVLYLGDEVIDIGTADEIAKRRDVKPSTIYHYSTQAYRKLMGSGTTAVACARMGLSCIGSEISSNQVAYAEERLAKESQTALALQFDEGFEEGYDPRAANAILEGVTP